VYLCSMAKFNKPGRSFSDKKRPQSKSKSGSFKRDKPTFSKSERGEREGYKAKRSFSRESEQGEKRTYSGSRSTSSEERGSRPYNKSKSSSDKKGFGRGSEKESPFKRERSERGGFDKKERSSFVRKNHSEDTESRSYSREKKEGAEEKLSYKQKRSFNKNKEFRQSDEFKKKTSRPFGEKREFSNKGDGGHKRPFVRDYAKGEKGSADRDNKSGRSYEKPERFDKENSADRKSFSRRAPKAGAEVGEARRLKYDELEEGRGFSGVYKRERRGEKTYEKKSATKKKTASADGLTRLNKYLANAGIASRRDADTLIKSGAVKVNGKPVTEMGFKINPGDVVTYGDAAVKSERKVYLLLNKPKDYITTTDDPQERKTVMSLVSGVCRERIYPVGRLDRNTTGLLLFTNDGELTKKLTHPKHDIKKVYHVSLNKGLKPDDFVALTEGVELEDGMIKADDLAFVGEGKKEVGIEIHSGRNRIVRRLFEHLGYEVVKLDRVTFAGLTKKDLPRGKHRFLTQKEVNFLQMIG
jgi:23S rRNA pseudouridine2605 synthase